jgi:hypothetical protein
MCQVLPETTTGLTHGAEQLITFATMPRSHANSPDWLEAKMGGLPSNSGPWANNFNSTERTMKLKILTLSALVGLALALCMTVTTPAAPKTPAAAAVPAATPLPNAAPAAAPEPHPEIRESIGALRRAKDHMQHAAHDFGGHRVEAIRATDEAIHQLEICLKFDK